MSHFAQPTSSATLVAVPLVGVTKPASAPPETGNGPGALVFQGKNPSNAQIRREQLKPAIANDGEPAAAYVAGYLVVHSTGPTWTELATAMDWPACIRHQVIVGLAKKGWLVTGVEPRSLRPGPVFLKVTR